MILPQNEAYRSSNKAVAQRGRPISSVRPVCELPTQCFVMRILAVGQAHFKWTYYIMSLANQCFVGTYTSAIQPTTTTTSITTTSTAITTDAPPLPSTTTSIYVMYIYPIPKCVEINLWPRSFLFYLYLSLSLSLIPPHPFLSLSLSLIPIPHLSFSLSL